MRARKGLAAALERLRHPGPLVLAPTISLAALVAGGLVAAIIALTYCLLLRWQWGRQRRRQAAQFEARLVIDAVTELAADLRIGRPASAALSATIAALGAPEGSSSGTSVRSTSSTRLAAVWRFAEATGAPLADLLDRFVAEVRAAEDVRGLAVAQTAGARATGWLLAALPVAALPVGYGMGVDPVAVLLYTPLGAGCVVAALALQGLGLVWTDRLVSGRL
jgi:tight adherence protein B